MFGIKIGVPLDNPSYNVSYGSSDGTIRVWGKVERKDAEKSTLKVKQILDKIENGHTQEVSSVVSFSDFFISGSWDGAIKLWKAGSDSLFRCIQTIEKSKHGQVVSLASNSNKDMLFAAFWDGTIKVFKRGEYDALVYVGEFKVAENGQFLFLALSEQGVFASASWDGGVTKIKLWQVDEEKFSCIQTINVGKNVCAMQSLVWSPKGLLAASFADGTIQIWEKEGSTLTCKQIIEEKDNGHTDSVLSISFNKNEELVSGSGDGTIKIWKEKEGRPFRCVQTIRGKKNGHTNWVQSVVFCLNDLFCSSYTDGSIVVWQSRCNDGVFVPIVFNEKEAFSHSLKALLADRSLMLSTIKNRTSVSDIIKEIYRGDPKQFILPSQWYAFSHNNWISFHKKNRIEEDIFIEGKEEKSKYFNFNIFEWGTYKNKIKKPIWHLGYLFAHIEDPPYDEFDKYVSPLYVLDLLQTFYGVYVSKDPVWHAILMCNYLAKYSKKGLLNEAFYMDLKKAKILEVCLGFDKLKFIRVGMCPGYIKEAGRKARKILKNITSYIEPKKIRAIKREAMLGLSYRYKIHLQVKQEWLVSVVNELVSLFQTDPRCFSIVSFKIVKHVFPQFEHSYYSGRIPGIIGIYLPLIRGTKEERHAQIKPFVQAIWDRFKYIAKKIHSGVRPRGNLQIKDFMYISAGEGLNKLELMGEEWEDNWKNTVYAPNYVSFAGHEIDPNLLLDE